MKALIADDESMIRHQLRGMLKRLWPELEIVSEAENGEQALDDIIKISPDVAFLDIRMPALTGLDVAREVSGKTRVVFITAFDNHAVEAFEQNAVDYLLKPITEERLQQTIDRLKKSSTQGQDRETLIEIIDSIRSTIASDDNAPLKWVKALRGDTVHMVHVQDVVYFKSSNKYTSAYTADEEYVIRIPLVELEARLDPSEFWRIHRGTIVNAGNIKSARKTDDGRYVLKLKDRENELDVSRTYSYLFRQM